jgi:hypothetical protein
VEIEPSEGSRQEIWEREFAKPSVVCRGGPRAGVREGDHVANETLQWAVLAVLAFLLLGALRQILLMLPPSSRAAVGGPEIGHQLPRRALRELKRVLPAGRSLDGALIAFVTGGCTGCQQLLRTLEERRPSLAGGLVILVTKNPSAGFRSAIDALDLPVIHDAEVWDACGITATPLVVRLDAQGRVTSKEVTHDVERLAAPAEAEYASSDRR